MGGETLTGSRGRVGVAQLMNCLGEASALNGVIPVKAGIPLLVPHMLTQSWILAFAGTTRDGGS